MLELPELDLVVVGAPNDLHCQIAVQMSHRRQTHRNGEALVPESGGGGPNDCRVRAGSRETDVCGGPLFRAQICPAQAAS